MAQQGRNESQTRMEIINSQLARAGWSKNRCKFIEEFLLQNAEPHHEVHRILAAALQELARMSAWHAELQSL